MSLWSGRLSNDDLSLKIFAHQPLPIMLPDTVWFFLPALSPEPSVFVVGTETERREAWGGGEVYIPRLLSTTFHPFVSHESLVRSGELFARALPRDSSAVAVMTPYDWSLYKNALDDSTSLFYSSFPDFMASMRKDAMYDALVYAREA